MEREHMMNEQAASEPTDEAVLEADVDTVIAACGGSTRAAIRALIIANEYLNAEVERLRASQSVATEALMSCKTRHGACERRL